MANQDPNANNGSYVERVREENQAYVRDLLAEAERLRVAVAELQSENARLRHDVEIVKREAATHAALENDLKEKLQAISNETQSYYSRYIELEHHNANLANLYVASYQLHGTLDREAVLMALQEIIVNLVGSEAFGVFDCDSTGTLQLLATVGGDDAAIVSGWPEVREVLASGETWLGDPASHENAVACVPMKLDGRVTGLVVIQKLLAHKTAFEPLDHELFGLLGTHAATALYCTALFERTRETAVS